MRNFIVKTKKILGPTGLMIVFLTLFFFIGKTIARH